MLALAQHLESVTQAPRYTGLIEGARAVGRVSAGEHAGAAAALTQADAAYGQTQGEPALGAILAIHRLTFDGRLDALAQAEALVAAHPSDDSRFGSSSP